MRDYSELKKTEFGHTTSKQPEKITDLTAELSPSGPPNQISLPFAKHSPRQNLPDCGIYMKTLHIYFEHNLCFFIELYVCPNNILLYVTLYLHTGVLSSMYQYNMTAAEILHVQQLIL